MTGILLWVCCLDAVHGPGKYSQVSGEGGSFVLHPLEGIPLFQKIPPLTAYSLGIKRYARDEFDVYYSLFQNGFINCDEGKSIDDTN